LEEVAATRREKEGAAVARREKEGAAVPQAAVVRKEEEGHWCEGGGGRRCLARSSRGEVACERTDRERVRRLVE
jgi:hypothetical protein